MQKLEQLFIETELKSWEQVFCLNYKFLNKFLYRGQSDYELPVVSSFERAIYNMYPTLKDKVVLPSMENEMLKEFKWRFPLYGQNPPNQEDNVEWLAIMQHYGAPTRLIDVTKSFFIAAYFATCTFNNKDAAVWAFNHSLMTEHSFFDYMKRHNTNTCSMDQLYLHSNQLANNAIGKFYKKDDPFSIMVTNPQRVNERILNQQAMFIMQSDIKRPFQEHLSAITRENVKMNFSDLIPYSNGFHQSEIAVLKIRLPKNISFDIRHSLKSMNISSESLFPGMEGMARSILHQKLDDRR